MIYKKIVINLNPSYQYTYIDSNKILGNFCFNFNISDFETFQSEN